MGYGLLHRVVAARALGGHRLWLRFDDGIEGAVDLRDVVKGFRGALAPLADTDYVAKVSVNEFGTIAWPSGLELDPIVLYCAVKGIPVPTYEDTPARRTRRTSAKRVAGRQSAARKTRVPHRRTGT